jgi:transcriptional regulator with XRE-family HTH domain
MDPKNLKAVQDAGWQIASVKQDACFVKCPSRGCGMMARIREGANIPQRIRPADVGEVRLEKYSDIRDTLRARRKDLRLTSAEVEEVAGFTFGHIAKAEQDNPHRFITLNTLIDWANSLGYRVALVPDALPAVTLRAISDTRSIEEKRGRHPKFRHGGRGTDRRA